MVSQVKFCQGPISKTHQISLKIETYQMEGLVKNGMLTHHTINILSKGGSHFKVEKLESG